MQCIMTFHSLLVLVDCVLSVNIPHEKENKLLAPEKSNITSSYYCYFFPVYQECYSIFCHEGELAHFNAIVFLCNTTRSHCIKIIITGHLHERIALEYREDLEILSHNV